MQVAKGRRGDDLGRRGYDFGFVGRDSGLALTNQFLGCVRTGLNKVLAGLDHAAVAAIKRLDSDEIHGIKKGRGTRRRIPRYAAVL
jgi:hypothetical protein